MGQTRKRKKNCLSMCAIPIPAIASISSFNGDDFYNWANKDWIKKASIPESETDYSISDEIQECIDNLSKKIIDDLHKKPGFFKDLIDSCLNNKDTSVDFLKAQLYKIDCINSVDDVFRTFAEMSKRSIPSIINFQQYIDSDKKIQIYLNLSSLGLYPSYYTDPELMIKYKSFLHKLGELLNIPDILKIFNLEKHMVYKNNEYSSDINLKIKGSELQRKFPRIPWDTWFTTMGLESWRNQTIYYSTPRSIRFIGKIIHEVPIHYWKIYLAKCYIVNSIYLLPPPYDNLEFEFFRKAALGQKKKMPQKDLLLKIIYNYLQEDFSRIFWERSGDSKISDEVCDFAKTIVNAAKRHLETTEWLMYKTRLAAIKKINYMDIQTVRPKEWAAPIKITLDPTNLLMNTFTLGEKNTEILISRIGHTNKYWSDGLYNVNAYYYLHNQLVIPYGSCISPFYTSKKNHAAWNYGGLGAIIGHEMCHAFDEEGKEYNEIGERKKWWLRKDKIAYNHKTKDLIKLFNRQKIGSHHIKGKLTLSENIADLAGVGISLQALKDDILKRHLDPEQIKEEYRIFFTSFAVSWRTKSRKEKLLKSIDVDVHAPAYLRVNLIVSQFDEWYAAFNIDSKAEMFIKPADRIRIF